MTLAAAASRVDRLALVTGGSRGLGRALCEELQAQGFRVIELSRSAPLAQSVRVDLSEPLHCAEAVRRALRDVDLSALEEFVCISNAATLEPIGAVSTQTDASIVLNLNVNLVSTITTVKAVMARLENVAARKVWAQVTSGAARSAHPGLSLYGAAKAGMEHFVRVVAAEQAGRRHPIVAIGIDPGAMDTAMQSQLRAARPEDYPAVAEFVRRHEQGALSAPAAVAATIVRIVRSLDLVPGRCYHVRDFPVSMPAC